MAQAKVLGCSGDIDHMVLLIRSVANDGVNPVNFIQEHAAAAELPT